MTREQWKPAATAPKTGHDFRGWGMTDRTGPAPVSRVIFWDGKRFVTTDGTEFNLVLWRTEK